SEVPPPFHSFISYFQFSVPSLVSPLAGRGAWFPFSVRTFHWSISSVISSAISSCLVSSLVSFFVHRRDRGGVEVSVDIGWLGERYCGGSVVGPLPSRDPRLPFSCDGKVR